MGQTQGDESRISFVLQIIPLLSNAEALNRALRTGRREVCRGSSVLSHQMDTSVLEQHLLPSYIFCTSSSWRHPTRIFAAWDTKKRQERQILPVLREKDIELRPER